MLLKFEDEIFYVKSFVANNYSYLVWPARYKYDILNIQTELYGVLTTEIRHLFTRAKCFEIIVFPLLTVLFYIIQNCNSVFCFSL